MAGKFSIYVSNDDLRLNIERLAKFDGVSITQIISRVLRAYIDTRADDIAFMCKQEDERQAYKQQTQPADEQAEAPASTPEEQETPQEEQQEEPEAPQERPYHNPNFLF